MEVLGGPIRWAFSTNLIGGLSERPSGSGSGFEPRRRRINHLSVSLGFAHRTGGDLLLLGSACLPVLIDAFRATSLPGYGRLPTIPAEARLFNVAAILSGACPSSFPSFVGVRGTRFGFLDVFGLAASVAGFGALRAGLRVALALPVFLVVGLGS